MRTALIAICAALLLVASPAPSDAARGTRKQCKQTCGARIAQDCAPFARRARRACKRAILRACRRVALESCFLTPATVDTTTTTTSTTVVPTTIAVVPTTAPLPTTTIAFPTSTKPPTTTTTLPFSFGGDWTFFGDLFFDDCPTLDPPFFDAEVLVTHTPGSSDIGVTVDLHPPLAGTADRFGFDASNVFDDDDCTVEVAFAAEVTGNPDLMAAVLVIEVACPTSSCTVAYEGDLEH